MRESKCIYELIKQRCKNSPTIFVGQYGVEDWHDRLGGKYCFKGIGNYVGAGRRLFLSGHTPDLGCHPPYHKEKAQGRYGQCAQRLQCPETNQGCEKGNGYSRFLSWCAYHPYVYATINPVWETVGAGTQGFEEWSGDKEKPLHGRKTMQRLVLNTIFCFFR